MFIYFYTVTMKIQEMQINSTRHMETIEDLMKQADDIFKALYDLQANTRNSNTVAGDTMDLIKRLRALKLSILEVCYQFVNITNSYFL